MSKVKIGDQVASDIVSEFKKQYPMKGWDGDGQEFFERVDETDLLVFFMRLYGLR